MWSSFNYLTAHQPVASNSINLQFTNTPHWQHIQSEGDLESDRPSVIELFCGNSQRVKAVGCFPWRAPSCLFDRILNTTWPNKLLQLEGFLRRGFPPLGLHKGILDSPCLLILLIYTKHKNNKMKFWTRSTSSFPWVRPGTKI